MIDTRGHRSWMQTFTGRAYFPLDPRPEEIFIEDIAHALSMICRYGGHTHTFYSVAEHSVLVSYMVPPELAFEGLMHDAAEAYCADVIRPIKRHLSEYAPIEELNMSAIRKRFGLPPTEHPLVKKADTDIIASERDALHASPPEGYTFIEGAEKDPRVAILALPPELAKNFFLKRFHELYKP